MVEQLEQMYIQAITQKDVQQIKLEAITGLLGELRQNKELVRTNAKIIDVHADCRSTRLRCLSVR